MQVQRGETYRRPTKAIIDQLAGELTLVGLHRELVLKLGYMKQFKAQHMGNERYMLRDLCKKVTRGNRLLIYPIRRITDQM